MKKTERTVYLSVIGTLLLIILLIRACEVKPKPCPEVPKQTEKIDTTSIRKIDTLRDTRPTLAGRIEGSPQPLKPKVITTGNRKYVILPNDTTAVLRDYNSTYIYSDTIQHQYGQFYIIDSIRQNAIINRNIISNINVPIITKTITLQEKKRNQMYVGVGLMGSTIQPITAIGAEIHLKTKADKLYSIGAYLGEDGIPVYKAGIHFKL